jgi:uncharacterized ferritin-like protein (DUF455 family)
MVEGGMTTYSHQVESLPMLMHLLTQKHNRVTGVIVRDELGHVIDVMSRWYDVLPNLISGEAYAC